MPYINWPPLVHWPTSIGWAPDFRAGDRPNSAYWAADPA